MSSAGIFGYLGGSIDNFLGAFVSSVSTAVAVAITPLVVTGLTIWIMVYGMAVMRHEVSEPIGAFLGKALKMSLVFAFALGSGLYQSEIVGGVQAIQNGFAAIVAPNASGDIYGVLDNFDEKGAQLALVILGHGMTLLPWGGWLDLFAGLLVFTGNAVMLIICGGFLIMAKTAIAFVTGIGPAFLVTLAFPPVAKFFDAWFAKIMNYTFLIIILAFVVGLSISISDGYIANFSKTQDDTNALADAFGLIILEGSLLILLWQSPNLASGLAGGASLSGGGLGNFVAGMIAGSSGKKKDDDDGDKGGGGGSVSGSGGGSNGGGSGGGSSGPKNHVPAYRRTTIDRLGRK